MGYDYNTSREFFFAQLMPAPMTNGSSYKEFWTRTTPVWSVADWWGNGGIMDSLVINTRAYAADWLSGAEWNSFVNSGRWGSLLIITKKDLEWKYGEKQAVEMIEYIDKKIIEQVGGPKEPPQREKPQRFYMRKNERLLGLATKALVLDGSVVIVCKYETFYGVDFDSWLRNGLKDIPCDIKVTGHNRWHGYPDEYLITFTGDFDEIAGGGPHPKH